MLGLRRRGGLEGSSGGKEVWRRGCAEEVAEPEIERAEGLCRFWEWPGGEC